MHSSSAIEAVTSRIRSRPNLFSKNAILFDEVIDDTLLMLIHPAGDTDD